MYSPKRRSIVYLRSSFDYYAIVTATATPFCWSTHDQCSLASRVLCESSRSTLSTNVDMRSKHLGTPVCCLLGHGELLMPSVSPRMLVTRRFSIVDLNSHDHITLTPSWPVMPAGPNIHEWSRSTGARLPDIFLFIKSSSPLLLLQPCTQSDLLGLSNFP